MPTVVEFPADLLSAAGGMFQVARRHITSPQPYTAHTRVSGPTDERWVAELTLPTKKRPDLDRFEAFFDLVDGAAGYVSAFYATRAYPRGTATGLVKTGTGTTFSDGATFRDGAKFEIGVASSTISAAGSKGAEYVTFAGLLADQAIGFARGDMFAIAQGSETYGFLHHVVSDAATDATGAATVRIRPRLREAVTVGQVVHFLRPRGVFRLAEDGAASVSRDAYGHGQPTLSLIEVHEALTCAL